MIGKRSHKILVICDYFTKTINAFDLTSFTSSSFITKFKEFLQFTGHSTRLLVVDNATFFSNKEVLTFLHKVGITKVRGNANHSESRGLVKSSIRILQTLIRKLLAPSPKYDFKSILFLAPVLLNRAPNPATGYSPYEALFGRDPTKIGPLSSTSSPPKYRLFSDTVKDDVAKLRKLIEDRISSISDKIQEEKQKFLDRANKGKSEKPAYPPGTIVFLRDFSIPNNGRAAKFRTHYLKSPNIVMSASETSVVTMRLGDSYISRHHPDDMLPYKEGQKDPALYDNLPQEVLNFLGKPISPKSLVELSEKDKLEIIYRDQHTAQFDPVMTRSRSQRKKEEEAKELAKNLEMESLYEEENEEDSKKRTTTASQKSDKKVTFGSNVAYPGARAD